MAAVLRTLALVTLAAGALALAPVAVAGLRGSWDAALPFVPIIAVASTGGLAFLRTHRTHLERGSAAASALLGWALFALLAAIPFWVAAQLDFVDPSLCSLPSALFEGTSAATSTGLTVVEKPWNLPPELQLWRSALQWVGGLGVLLLAIAVVEPAQGGSLLYRSVARAKTLGDGDVGRTTRAAWTIYIGLTLAVCGGYRILGMDGWQALNHGLTTVSTGGFTINEGGTETWSKGARWLAALGMVLGAVSFVSHHRALVGGRPMSWIGTPEHRWFLGLLLIGGLASQIPDQPADRGDRLFLWLSSLTTTGYSTAAPSGASPVLFGGLGLGMVLGGMAGSTAGGLKTSRMLALLDLARGTARQRPMAMILVIAWVVTAALGTILLRALCPGRETGDLLFEVLSAMGCVGLSSGVTSEELAPGAKLVLCALMWLGRLELLGFCACGALERRADQP